MDSSSDMASISWVVRQDPSSVVRAEDADGPARSKVTSRGVKNAQAVRLSMNAPFLSPPLCAPKSAPAASPSTSSSASLLLSRNRNRPNF